MSCYGCRGQRKYSKVDLIPQDFVIASEYLDLKSEGKFDEADVLLAGYERSYECLLIINQGKPDSLEALV